MTLDDNQELSQLIQQANSKREAIALVQEGQPKAVLLSFAMFQHLIGISDSVRVASRREALRRNRREQLSNEGFATMSHQLFTKSGYDSTDKIMQLIQDVKQEISTEREQRLNDGEIKV